ncbi:hypothetical protein GGR57DRAFT_126756 [Xylariaceae sp. FL1272]|nr:hypothetical protein GGR57DRAFT_126756 [Xylariaceae sp. FL1272]
MIEILEACPIPMGSTLRVEALQRVESLKRRIPRANCPCRVVVKLIWQWFPTNKNDDLKMWISLSPRCSLLRLGPCAELVYHVSSRGADIICNNRPTDRDPGTRHDRFTMLTGKPRPTRPFRDLPMGPSGRLKRHCANCVRDVSITQMCSVSLGNCCWDVQEFFDVLSVVIHSVCSIVKYKVWIPYQYIGSVLAFPHLSTRVASGLPNC